jgi:hypothetical protein
MSCVVGYACKHKLHELPQKFATVKVSLSCGSCRFVATARGGEAVIAAMRDHYAGTGCERVE